MNSKLKSFVEKALSSLTLSHHCKKDNKSIEQIDSYHGPITLIGFINEMVSIGVHYNGNTCHILLIEKDFESVISDPIGTKMIVPIVVFCINISDKTKVKTITPASTVHGDEGVIKVSFKPGRMDKICTSCMSIDLFLIFQKMLNLTYRPRK